MRLTARPIAPSQPSPTLVARVQSVVDGWREHYGVPGVAVSIRDAGTAVVDATSGVASLTSGRALQSTDRLWAGSITKTATAAVTLGLVSDGRLSLDDRLARWHPDVPNADRITVRQLLDHTSGLPDLSNEPGTFRDHAVEQPLVPWDRQRLLAEIVRHPGAVEPGSRFLYSNANYMLLGDLLEQVTGTPLDELMRTRLFEPAGATSALLDLGRGDNPSSVASHAGPGGGAAYVDRTATFGPGSFIRSTLGAAGALVTTAPDLARIGESILWKDGAAMDAGVRGQMLDAAEQSPDGYGLGAFALRLYAGGDEPSRVYGHNGHLGGAASALVLHVPDTEQTISVMLPSDPPGDDAMEPAARLASRLLDLVAGRDDPGEPS